ncbi:hypothetical protein LY78DRAFT_595000, partial [Colletotrichum sublineola]
LFHTSPWNYNITGGSQEHPDLTNLKDKGVAIIGTGTTSVQDVPHLAKWAKHLYVIQRTPSYCGERGQQETTPESWSKVATGIGWQRRRMANLNSFLTANPEPIADELRACIDREVRDAATAEKLKPWYLGWCKRPTFNDDYLETSNRRSNVTLVDTNGKGIDRYTERGLVVGGHELDIDVLVLATGFTLDTHLAPEDRVKAPIIGRSGRHLNDKWDSLDFGTLFGVAVNGFPNLFAYFNAGSASSYNFTSVLDETACLIAHIITQATRESSRPESLVIEASKESEDKWTEEVMKRAGWYSALSTCTPSYFTAEGATLALQTPEQAKTASRKAAWGTGPDDYQRIVEEYKMRTENKLEGFSVYKK